jgi:PAS domain S-box-containing protein
MPARPFISRLHPQLQPVRLSPAALVAARPRPRPLSRPANPNTPAPAMRFGWKLLRIPGFVFIAAALVLVLNSAIPVLLWDHAVPAGWIARRAAAPLDAALTSVLHIAIFVWLYFRLIDRYIDRLDLGIASAMDGVITATVNGDIVLINPAAQAMFGRTADETLGRHLELLVPERHRAQMRRQMAEMVAVQATAGPPRRELNATGLRANGDEFPIEGSVTCVGANADRLFTMIVRDVTARRQSQLQLGRLASIVESSSDAILSKDLEGHVTTWNAAAERMFGHTAAEMTGQSILRLLPPDRVDEEARIIARIRMGESIRHFDTVRCHKDGSLVDVSLSIAPLRDHLGRVVGASTIARDISEQKKAAAIQADYVGRLQELSRRLMETEEQERRRLGNELHDRTGSNLTALSTTLAVIRSMLPAEIERDHAARFAECDVMLRETMDHVRHVLADLRPTALDIGLLAALNHLASRVRAQTGLPIEVSGHEPSPRPDSDTEIALFRIAQEAVNNAAKHSRAALVRISLAVECGVLRLEVSDDGRGFAAGMRKWGSSSLGMTTMRERAEAIHASLAIHSRPGAGTAVTVERDLGPPRRQEGRQ